MNKLSENLKIYLIDEQMTLSELSRISGIRYSTLSDLKNGKTNNPTIETMELLEKATEIDMTVWLYGKDIATKKQILKKIGGMESNQKELEIIKATVDAIAS